MGEVVQGSVAFLAFFCTILSAWLWMLGGRSLKELAEWHLDCFGVKSARVWGRIIAPLFFSCFIIGISLLSDTFHTIYFLFVPLYIWISTSGHHSFFRRLIECWCYALPSLLILPYNSLTFIMQLLLATVAAVIGHFDREKKAPVIEFIVNFLRIALVAVMAI